ncbi:hypothetical protein FE633_08410 [Streptomyces montanus]|uniref:Uncharacterized protein n=1 Tax=Streptomyces montanus TaxID=2580423 RepID=A0A5R9FRT4_9ACTN|nr:hypothetical protein [Streptomyces montanus]TLS46697.1 hypothetical protein FE633_08410 [Streptomyces montanus]
MARYRRRLCMAVDLRQYSRHTYTEQADAQARLRLVVEHALRRARILRVRTQQQLQGDGRLVVFPARTDLVRAVPKLILGLRDGLYEANQAPGAFGRMRMRAALGLGSISRADSGYLGDCVVLVSRLVDSDGLRNALERNDDSDLALAVPHELYRDVIVQQAHGLPASDFRQTEVVTEKKEFAADAWLYVPRSAPARDPSPEPVIWGHSPGHAAMREFVVPALAAAHLAATVVSHSQALREWALPESGADTGYRDGDFDGPDHAGPHDAHHADPPQADPYHPDPYHPDAHHPDPHHPDPHHPDPHHPDSQQDHHHQDPHHHDLGHHIHHFHHGGH